VLRASLAGYGELEVRQGLEVAIVAHIAVTHGGLRDARF
jgi:hypothetical protein